ncbi:MAG: glycosyltransferase family 4 protein [Bacteroidia bacterium]|jgi:glycosyltransferase involved in cell wall biosynthesis|nr:glycosyltransferase family 4 protein [Bacteroidia bacterium]
MAQVLNIAHCVESYAPAKGGMPEVVRQLSERMAAAGHKVTVFTSAHAQRTSNVLNGVHINCFHLSGNEVNGIKGNTGEYLEELRRGNFDVVVFFAAQQWAFDSVADELDSIPGKKVFVPTGFSHFHNSEYRQYFEKMKTRIGKFDANVFLSDNYADINFARQHNARGIQLIPNGAAEEEFEAPQTFHIRQKLGIAPDALLLLHVGSYTGIKGQREAIEIFIRARLKNAVLLLAGDKNRYLKQQLARHPRFLKLNLLRLLKRKRIIIAELTREETVQAFREADLFLFPSNVECSPIVLFESMAAGVPFLASAAGNTEEIITWSKAGWLLPSTRRTNGWVDVKPDESTALLEKLAADRTLLKQTGKAGREVWKARFTWAHIAGQYTALYQQLISGAQ